METKLTGKRRFRKGFLGTVVLQVQYEWEYMDSDCNTLRCLKWRDAKMQDITESL